ncbi:transcription factor LHW-like isoform X2 [Tripterygium wilfordii]|uniref:transcription factor LHW-like isoform X2 n=1 Tax=Tripterygium wilfordii TaxID=458696 RepID=UPI0018F8487A|nr:transcription factor LHW-like isoform X2 [Tripterygium wilfordii]
MGSALKGKLKSLCCSGGWSYGVFWRFDPRNPMLLTFEDAYHEEQMGPLVNDKLLQVHILGEGIMGKVAKTGNHQWIFSDNCGDDIDLLSLTRSRDEFQDNFEFLPQFSCGIKTIAIISMKSQGVVEFGARQKILENEEFLDKTKKLSEETVNTDGFISLDNIPASMNDEDYNLNEWFDSLISPGNSCNRNMTTMDGSNSEALVRKASLSTSITPLSPSALDLYDGGMTPLCIDSSLLINQLIAAETETLLLSSGMPYTESPNAEASSSSMWNGERSISTSFESQLPSEFWVDTITFPTTVDSLTTCGNMAENKQACSTFGLVDVEKRIEEDSRKFMGIQHSAPLVHATNSELQECATNETNFNFSMDISDFSVVSNLSECFVPSLEDCIDDVTMEIANDLSEAIGVTSDLYDGQQRSVVTSAAEYDLYEGLGLNFESSRKVGKCWEEILMPAVSCERSAISNGMSECISGLDVARSAGRRKGLFSELGLEELFDCSSKSNSFTKSNFEHQLSTTKRRRMDSLTANDAKMQPVYNLDKTNTLLFKKEAFPKSQVGLWIDDSYSINAKDNAIAATAKKPEEPSKATKKRARPGESTRPRPKDRQQIQDRLKELRGIIPNSGKCSIDSLLDLTIKHMQFLQSITQYADELKQIDKQKISHGNGLVRKDNIIDSSSYCGDAMRAFDFSSQTMVCPIIVKDLNTRGHMLIEMLCEDRGFFLEIADIIRGFGLNILKGIMETRDDKIWAHFIVERNKEVTGQVTRQEVFWSLLQLIQDTATSGIDSMIQPSNIMDSVIPPLDGYQQSSLPLPISVADTLQ